MSPKFPKQLRSIQNLQDTFTGNWFPAGDALPEQITKAHDAAHQWANINPTPRGELQQGIVDMAGTSVLADQINAIGFPNQVIKPPFGSNKTHVELADIAIKQAIQEGNSFTKRSLFGIAPSLGKSFTTFNDPGRFIFPSVSESEVSELKKRGQEFYSKVGEAYQKQIEEKNISPPIKGEISNMDFSPSPGIKSSIKTTSVAKNIHENPNIIKISGGYDSPGKFSYGPIEQRFNSPLEITVDQPDWAYAGKEFLNKYIFPTIQKETPGSKKENINQRTLERSLTAQKYGGFLIDNQQSEPDQLKQFQVQASELPYRPTTDVEFSASEMLIRPRAKTAYDALFAVAKNRGNLRNIIKGAATSATDIAGSVPLFDPTFRQAVEQGDIGKVARQLGTEYAIGTAAAPVVGMGVGALNQVAPQAARIVAGGLNAARTVNPIAVVSQLGGSSKINKKADEQAAKSQLLRAEAARRRGSKWKFPTPFGTLQIPELGLSEAGGLFFR
jgi:hypothetical protein